MSDISISEPQEVFALMHGMREKLTPIDQELARVQAERRELISHSIQAIGAPLFGRMVTATKIGEVEEDYTIGVYDLALNNGNVWGGRTVSGERPGPTRYFIPPDLRSPSRDKVTGKMVGVDLKTESLVLKSRVPLVGSYFWVRLINNEGDPVVTLDVHD